MANENNVPLGAYIDPLLRVDWMGRYITAHSGYFRLTRRAVLLYVALVMVGLVLSMIPGVRHVNWIIGLTVQIVALIALAMPGNFVAAFGLGFASGQPGREKGFDIKDGTEKAWDFTKAFGRFIGYVTFFAALPFMALGLFPTTSNPVGALIILALSISLTIGGIMLYESAKAFMRLVWLIYLLVVLWILAGFVPGLREMQEKVTSAGGGFIATRIVDNPADEAKKKAESKQREVRIQAAKNCFEKLPDTPTPEAKAMCDALHRAIDVPLLGELGLSSVNDKLAPGVEQAKKAVEDLGKWASGTVSTGFEKKIELPAGYDPNQKIEVCGLPPGVHLYKVFTTPVHAYNGEDRSREYELSAPNNGTLGNWQFLLGGKMPTERVAIPETGCEILGLDIPPRQKEYVVGYRTVRPVTIKIVLE